MILVEKYECPCNPHFRYKNRQTYHSHLSSKRHKMYNMTSDVRVSCADHKRLENENEFLRHRVQQLESQVDKLISHIGQSPPVIDLLSLSAQN